MLMHTYRVDVMIWHLAQVNKRHNIGFYGKAGGVVGFP